jgi:hypothetical protein
LPESLSTEQLLTLYRIAIEEYRFQVKLNWDRTAYYFTLNSGIIAVATGLLKVGSSPVVNLLVALVFFIGLCASLIAIKNVHTGHEYYRRTLVKKTLFEDQLGLTKPSQEYPARPTLAVGTTVGQNDHLRILHDTEKWLKRPLRSSITAWIVRILILFCVFNALGIAGSLRLSRHPATAPAVAPSVRILPV